MARVGRQCVVPRWLMNESQGARSMPISTGARPVEQSPALPIHWMYDIMRAVYTVPPALLPPYIDV
jgi:hypothetical protein